MRAFLISLIFTASVALPAAAFASVDEDGAQSLAKKGNCFKCHAVEKRKKAPSYREIAAKHKGKSDAETYLWKHLHGETTVKTDDGDEKHSPPPTENRAEIENLIRWILSL